MKLCITRLHLI